MQKEIKNLEEPENKEVLKEMKIKNNTEGILTKRRLKQEVQRM